MNGSRRRLASLLAVVAAGLLGPRAFAGDPHETTVAALAGYAKQIETNVSLAVEAAGPGEGKPPEAKARLARSRLASAEGLVPQVRDALTKLPKDHEGAVAIGKRLDAAQATIDRLKARLDGRGAAPKPSGGGAPLDHRQKRTLDDAEFFVREIEGLSGAIAAEVREFGGVADQDSIDHRRVKTAMNTVAKVEQRTTQVRERLDSLPADGEGVKEVADRLAVAVAAVATSKSALVPLDARLSALVDPRNYPSFAEDLKRLHGLASMYAEAERVLGSDPRRGVALVAESAAAAEEFGRFRAAYGALIRQETEEGRRAGGAAKHFEGVHAAYAKAAEARAKALPAEVDAEVAAVRAMADEAVDGKKPAFFSHGIPDRVRALADRVALLSALDSAAGADAAKRLEALRAELARREASLVESIVEANGLPADAYAGDDRKAVEAAAVEAWKASEPAAETLGVRIPAREWRREVLLRRQNSTWYWIDRSHLQALVLVKRDERLVVVRAVDLWVDHEDGGKRSAFPLLSPKDPVPPQHLLLRSKVR